MNTYRKTAIIVGVLFIIGTVAGILSGVFGPDLNAQNYLTNLSSNESKVIAGALLEFLMAIAVVGIAVAIFPILKRLNERFALGYVVARTVEGLLFTISVISLLALLTLGRESLAAAAPAASNFQTMGACCWQYANGVGECVQLSFSAWDRLCFIIYCINQNLSPGGYQVGV